MEKIINTKEVITSKAEAKVVQFLQEARKNHTLVGSPQKPELHIAYYQPHNYRLYFDFSRDNFNTKPTLDTHANRGILSMPYTDQISNKTEIIFKFENCCTIRVKRSVIEITNMLDHKRYYPIEWNDKIYDQILAINERKDNECIQILKDFLSLFGGVSRLEIRNRYVQEHKLADEASIKQIPLPMKFYTDIVKKEYNEPNVEYKTAMHAATYLENRAMERIAPEIQGMVRGILEINASTSKTLNQFITTFMPIQQEHSINIRTHTEVLKSINKSFNKFNRLLSERQKKMGDWL